MIEVFVLSVVVLASVIIGIYVYEQALESNKKLVVLAVVSPLSMFGLMLPVVNLFESDPLIVLVQEQLVLFGIGFVLSLVIVYVTARVTSILKK